MAFIITLVNKKNIEKLKGIEIEKSVTFPFHIMITFSGGIKCRGQAWSPVMISQNSPDKLTEKEIVNIEWILPVKNINRSECRPEDIH